jgi:hypothetical protein
MFFLLPPEISPHVGGGGGHAHHRLRTTVVVCSCRCGRTRVGDLYDSFQKFGSTRHAYVGCHSSWLKVDVVSIADS